MGVVRKARNRAAVGRSLGPLGSCPGWLHKAELIERLTNHHHPGIYARRQMRTKRTRTLSRLALAMLALLMGSSPAVLGQSALLSYQGPRLPDPALQAMRLEPIWRDRLDSATAVVTGTAAVYLREGRLVATELTSGWQQWSYGSGLTGPLLLAADRVLVAEGPWVSALHASEGRVLWSRNVSGAPVRHMRLTPGALLVSSGEAGAALLNLETGEVVRTLDVPAGTEPLFANGALALFGSEHAEPGETWLHAFDLHSGLEL